MVYKTKGTCSSEIEFEVEDVYKRQEHIQIPFQHVASMK